MLYTLRHPRKEPAAEARSWRESGEVGTQMEAKIRNIGASGNCSIAWKPAAGNNQICLVKNKAGGIAFARLWRIGLIGRIART